MHVSNFLQNGKRMKQLQSAKLKRELQTRNHGGEKKKSELQVLPRGRLNDKPSVRRRSACWQRKGQEGMDEEGGSLRRRGSHQMRVRGSEMATHNPRRRLRPRQCRGPSSNHGSTRSCSCHLLRRHSNVPQRICGPLHRQCSTIPC